MAEEFARAGVQFMPAQKAGRLGGWNLMRTMLRQAGQLDSPGLYVARRCRYWWSTVPMLARDPRRPEDLDTAQADHGADAARYALTYQHAAVGVVRLPRNH